MNRRTKIVATIGPACEHPDVLEAMLRAGVDVIRLNLSHGPLDEHIRRLKAVRAAALVGGRPIAVLADLPGANIRAGRFPDGGLPLAVGEVITCRPGNEESTAGLLTVDYPALLTDVKEGDKLVVGDGGITLRVTAVNSESLTATVETGGFAQGRPGVHLPSERFRLASPTDEDLQLAAAMAAEGVEFIGVSFVRDAADLERVRSVIIPHKTRLVSKIETIPAVANLSAIVEVSDAVMVAR